MKYLRLYGRLLFFAVYTTRIVLEIYLRNLLQGADLQRSMRIRRRWARRVLKGVGLQIQRFGDIPEGNILWVGNHRSYLDPIILLREIPAWPVAKAEIADWPVIGKGAALAGILYVRRADAQHRARVLGLIREKLEEGYPVILFPEGDTCAIPDKTLPFLSGGFKLAAKYGYKIVPVAFHFPDVRDFWVGDQAFLEHAMQRFGEPHIQVRVFYGPLMQGSDGQMLLEQAQGWIEQCLREQVQADEKQRQALL
ncbi:MAG: 1-acyl-sn-glycerol-3-phosphate acyltransferase [Bacteroidetes bacterium]|nr:1-acyl-sn-glycerol-3-phosphate acyltransferase [Bacteroidota bacterium]